MPDGSALSGPISQACGGWGASSSVWGEATSLRKVGLVAIEGEGREPSHGQTREGGHLFGTSSGLGG